MNKPGKIRQAHFKGRFLSLVEVDDWEFCSRSNASGVVILIAVTNADELLLVEQYRVPVDRNVIELPAGLVGDTDDPEESMLEAAQRELYEETGFEAGHYEILMSCPSTSGMSDEIVTFVKAHQLERTGPGGGDESEDITVHTIPLGQVESWLKQRQLDDVLIDPKIFSALFWLKQLCDD